MFVWENFGPIHADRADAVARRLAGTRSVIGLELAGQSETYEWKSESGSSFQKITLFANKKISSVSRFKRIWRSLRACLTVNGEYFLCHYEHFETFTLAIILRFLGRKVFVMNDSKFDDRQRFLIREIGKSIMYYPYSGAIAASYRARDYFIFLGIPKEKIALNYNALSLSRIRELASAPPAPNGVPFSDRHFTIVARLVPKKNLSMALDAYAKYVENHIQPRRLHIYGSGELELELRQKTCALGLEELVSFHGFVQTETVARAMAQTLALLLPSIEEQYGNVVIEAQAMGVPVILSNNCGVCDIHVRSGVNGFVIEADNAIGMSFFMGLLSEDEKLWRRMALAARETAWLGDVACFAEAVACLIGAAKQYNTIDGAQAKELVLNLEQRSRVT